MLFLLHGGPLGFQLACVAGDEVGVERRPHCRRVDLKLEVSHQGGRLLIERAADVVGGERNVAFAALGLLDTSGGVLGPFELRYYLGAKPFLAHPFGVDAVVSEDVAHDVELAEIVDVETEREYRHAHLALCEAVDIRQIAQGLCLVGNLAVFEDDVAGRVGELLGRRYLAAVEQNIGLAADEVDELADGKLFEALFHIFDLKSS